MAPLHTAHIRGHRRAPRLTVYRILIRAPSPCWAPPTTLRNSADESRASSSSMAMQAARSAIVVPKVVEATMVAQ
jgi:hypothetical protein